MSTRRRSSFPPKLQKFINAVEDHARTAGHTRVTARIFGAWAACFVRFCALSDRDWRSPEDVPAFLGYLERRQDVDTASRQLAAEALAFLFERLLKTDVSSAAWHPDRRRADGVAPERAPRNDGSTSEEGEQSALLTSLVFHTSLPIQEALQLRAGDVDIEAGLIYVSDPAGTPKRIVRVPKPLKEPLRRLIRQLRRKHGSQYLEVTLFEARAIHGRVAPNGKEPPGDSSSEATKTQKSSGTSGKPSSLWGYAEAESSN